MSAQQMNERNFHIFYRMLCNPVTVETGKEKEKVLFDGDQMGFSPEEKQKYVFTSCLMLLMLLVV